MENSLKDWIEEARAEAAKRNKLLSYWCRLFEGLSYSPQDLYAGILANLSLRDVPALEPDQVLIRQSGLFSPERLYLRLRRERLVFEICGAPFGNGFFVSSRLFDRRKDATLMDFLIIFVVLAAIGTPVWFQFGWRWGLIAVTGAIALVWSLMRLATLDPVGGLDRVLSDLPVISGMYDWLFHPETYYRQDLNNCYREAVHHALMQTIDGLVSQKGLKPLTAEEHRPVLRSLDRP